MPYAPIHGLQLYYEIHGSGSPLVLLHGGGSTIASAFGRILPQLALTHQVIAIESQAHGHTRDIDRVQTFESDADDVAALLKHLGITQADILGFSNGGTTALQIAIRHPQIVRRLVLAAATYRRDSMIPGFFDSMAQATLDTMPQPLQEAYLTANPNPKGLQAMFDRDVARMINFKDIADPDIRAIQAPTLVINGDNEVILAEHAFTLSRTLPHARLAILPCGHGDYLGDILSADPHSKIPTLVVAMIEEFLAG
ncbi:MAG: alpha/beta hydrolase [Bacteroidetes bacterium]|nr:alpha/beta hydrolase [Bacteroidota bacterium]